ncbi:type II toxin-antitoxin system death-on-curing family toxin [Luteolibacter sp. GHJ8]|uniref:Type II toxin-antitoxin system death-on-curing family toxin n=1 Tax=Luteolibacter rhizosphaerae TaxID=2989719 RepID=A0ABT3G8N3_9BACT|nr:type II toxin-antitoxin system death-on-curing family toxin [Luteolibacter rhizosphaerae]MCW1915954.1 type II toxin-antitoxin system death-on-curing family toxin [Luteolibacter rhizosphaerae]
MAEEPFFLSLDHVEAIHRRSLAEHGGAAGIADPGGLESAAMQARNVYHYLRGDLFEIAAAYAFHIAEAQACIDGNKRTAAASALIFLECNGVDTTRIDPMKLYQPMIDISAHRLDRAGMAKVMRELFS